MCACGAWLGHLGLEPTPDEYVEHLVECFRHVRRVLHPHGSVWLNIGDSYAGSGKGPSKSLQPNASQLNKGPSKQSTNLGSLIEASTRGSMMGECKPKDAMEIPSMVAAALRKDGWYLRCRIPWIKKNALPESVKDRPVSAIEYVFLLAKSRRYFYDREAVRILGPQPGNGKGTNRARRNSDWFFESWQGMVLDEEGDPLAFIVNPSGIKEAHYATFSPKLIEPMVRAATSQAGCCPECGVNWIRQDGEPWHAACDHGHRSVPCVILDPFGGASTVGLVGDRLGRDVVICELSEEYTDLSERRLVADAPLFAQLSFS